MICSIDNCKRKVRYRTPKNLCQLHWHRWYRHKRFDTPIWHKPSLTKNGYIRINIGGKRVLEHRHVVEKAIGRKLENREQIHHKNGVKTDNRIENLEIVSPSVHISKYHKKTPIIDWSKISVPGKTTRWNPHNIKKCLIKTCNSKAKTRCLCQKHYVSFCRNG